jgi:hypothetical protein
MRGARECVAVVACAMAAMLLLAPPAFSAGTWSPTGSLNTAREGHTANLLPGGKVLVAGGVAGFTPLASAELYDPVTGAWTATG